MEKTNFTFKKMMRPLTSLLMVLCMFSYVTDVSAQGGATCAAATAVGAGTHTTGAYTGGGASAVTGDGCWGASATDAEWYSFTAPSEGTFSVSSCGFGQDTRLSVYTAGSACGALTCLAMADDSPCGGFASEVTGLAACPGETFLIEWDDRWGPGSHSWDLTFVPAATPAMPVASVTGSGCSVTIEATAGCSPFDLEICPSGTASGGAGCVAVTAATLPYMFDACGLGFPPGTSIDVTLTNAAGTSPVATYMIPAAMEPPCAANNLLWSENFDGFGTGVITAPDWFIQTGGTGSGGTGPIGARSAPNYLYWETSGGAPVPAPHVVASGVALPASPVATLELYTHFVSTFPTNTVDLEISTDGGATWANLDTYTTAGGASAPAAQADPFVQRIYSLAAFAGMTIDLRFVGTVDTGFDDFAVDDMAITIACPDVCPPMLFAMTAPAATITNSTCFSAGAINPISCPDDSFAEYSIDGGATWSAAVPAYTTMPITVVTRCVCDNNPANIAYGTAVTTAPIILGPPVANCSPGITLTLVGGVATLTAAQVNNGSTAQCGTAEVQISQETFTCDDVSPVEVTLTVTDSQTGAIAMCTTPVTLLTPPPTMVCAPSTVTLDAAGNATIMGADVDGGSIAACGDPVLSVAPSAFTCAEVGVQTVTLTGADPATGITATCEAEVIVLGSQFCVDAGLVTFGNDDPALADPCTCDGVGGFDEEIIVHGNGAGEGWFVGGNVSGVTYGPGPGGAAVASGDPLTDLGNGDYVLLGLNHLDAAGYIITLQSPFYPGVTLRIDNQCFYPLVLVDVPFDTVACEFTDAIPLVGQGVSQRDGVSPVDGVGTFTVNGVVATELDPLDLGVGTHTVEFCFDAGEALGFTRLRGADPDDVRPFAQNLAEAQMDPGCEVCQTSQFVVLGTPSSIACNDRINVSLESSCSALITADMVLEGNFTCLDDYEVALSFNNVAVANPVDYNLAGQVITTQVTHLPSGNQCWGELILEDKFAPVLNCDVDFGEGLEGVFETVVDGASTFLIPCTIDPADIPAPTASDNCTGTEVFLVSETVVFEAACNAIGAFTVIQSIERTYGVKDINGNEGNQCTVGIQVYQVPMQFPDDITWSCEQFAANNSIVDATGLNQSILNNIVDGQDDVVGTDPYVGYPSFGANTWWSDNEDLDITLDVNDADDALILAATGSGIPRTLGQQDACKHSFTFVDDIAPACEGADITKTFKIIRTWTALNWCTGGTMVDVQIIKVLDTKAPVIVFNDDDNQNGVPDENEIINGIERNGAYGNNDGFNDLLVGNITSEGSHPECVASGIIGAPVVSDNCTEVVSLRVFTPVGEATPVTDNAGNVSGYQIPEPYLPLGIHDVTYEAIDQCGNTTRAIKQIQVVDGIVPTAICREVTQIALGSNSGGITEVIAEFFDEASFDNCAPVYFKVRKLEGNTCNNANIDKFNETNFFWLRSNGIDTIVGPQEFFDDEVKFCCEEKGETIQIVLRVYDENPGPGAILTNTSDQPGTFDPLGHINVPRQLQGDPAFIDAAHLNDNYNDCTIEVQVEDKVRPVCVAPADVWVNCSEVADNIDFQDFDVTNALYGEATGFDNCSYIVEGVSTTVDLDLCGVGSITRTFRTIDCSDNRSVGSCSQTIMIQPVTEYCITFPEDFEGECDNSFSPAELEYDEIGCDLIAVNRERLDFFAGGPDGECKKEIYTWQVINWCEYDGISMPTIVNRDGTGNGNVDDGEYCSNGRTLSMGSISYPSTGFYQWEQLIKIFDNTPPEVSYDGDVEFCGGDLDEDPCTGQVDISIDILELCTDQLTSTWSISANSSSFANADINGGGNSISMRLPLGTHTARFDVADDCGNESQIDITFTIIDCKAPTPVCYNGLSVDLMPTGMVSVWANDFDASSFDYCHDFEVTANVVTDRVRDGVINSADYMTTRPTTTEIMLDCGDVGTITFVQLWVHELSGDGVNDDDYCVTFIEVQDNNGVCASSRASIAGNVSDEKGENIENVDVNLSVDMTSNFMTTNDGNYSFAVNEGGDYSITPMKNDDIRNGVSTFDLALISKHVLNVAPLNSPYKIIAADANNSGSVTTLDLVAIRKLVLFVANDFPNNTSWRFVDKDYVFTNAQNPFASVFPEVKNFNNMSGANIADFVGIKIGDVSGDARANGLSSIDDRSIHGTFNMNTEEQSFEAGEEVRVAVNADLNSIDGFQATLNFNNKAVELLDIESGSLTKENFGTTMTSEGIITVSWNGEATSQEAFTLVFTAKAAGTVSDVLSISSTYTVAEAYQGADYLNVGMTFGGTQVAQVFNLHQNTPNPFASQTTIGFELPQADAATLTISDLSGKVLRVIKGNYEAGFNSVVVQMTNNLPMGVLVYELETSTDKATKKMTIVK